MIYTLTLNPSIDYIMHVDKLQPGGLTRSTATAYYPGGKGINVSRVLSNLSVPSTALGFIGGFTGEFIRTSLKEKGVKEAFIETDEPTRINVKLKDGRESEINGPGPELSDSLKGRLLEQLHTLTPEDVLLIAGSVPSSLPEDFYREIAENLKDKGVPMAVDTSGRALKDLLSYHPYLIKPNRQELEELFGETMEDNRTVARYAEKLVEEGCRNVLISLGGDGAVYANHEGIWFAEAPKGPVVNTVGAGDSMVAGFLAAKEVYLTDEEAFKKSIACGSATAFGEDLCTKEEAEALYDSIHIYKEGERR
ncbi:1-phosphofructokinase [Salimicrobium jeotgali]|uniref:Tagatose-6-phosphate kinase n=1 Tax=Salimicrobium jeotgali TaxID=1230341 RepID=K2GFR9_9BACI|nr:1-phosphofructokinase [Salimicrobium jeotgali]AKG03953.1 1-phosphofructokinase [Salimicrobium jeotgali]EKE32987.1 1-phosphofructokinase [Salimicrobium jeotgali]MBM7695017.1 1-phosphofructokinase [Salimicrobium jeotgali]